MYLDISGEMIPTQPLNTEMIPTQPLNTNLLIRYFDINRIPMLTVGLWPFQQSKLVRLQLILCISILITFIIFQLTAFITAKFSFILFNNVFSSVLCFLCAAFNHGWFWSNIQHVRSLLEQVYHICSELKDENEIAIIEKYRSNMKRLTINITMFGAFSIVVYISLPLLPHILSFFLLLNESQSNRIIFFSTEYFIDEEKYSYLILLHINAAIYICITVIVTTGLIIMTSLKYACGMFKIASYRLEQANAISTLKNISLENNIMIYKKIIFAVDIQRKAMQFSEFILSKFEIMFSFLIGVSVVCVSLNIFGILLFKNDIGNLILPVGRVFTLFLCMFFGNYAGQEIIDHNNHIFSVVYNIQWYNTSLYVQKIILFILQRGSKAFNLNVCGLFIPSLDGFATMATTSISYFTVIRSLQ